MITEWLTFAQGVYEDLHMGIIRLSCILTRIQPYVFRAKVFHVGKSNFPMRRSLYVSCVTKIKYPILLSHTCTQNLIIMSKNKWIFINVSIKFSSSAAKNLPQHFSWKLVLVSSLNYLLLQQ